MNLEGYATSSVSIALSWEEPQVTNGKISKYIITFVEVYLQIFYNVIIINNYVLFNLKFQFFWIFYLKGDNEEITRETTSTMHDLIDLVPYTEYSIKVQAVNENGPGVFSRDIVVRTYSAQPTQPPHNVTVEPVSPTVRILEFRIIK